MEFLNSMDLGKVWPPLQHSLGIPQNNLPLAVSTTVLIVRPHSTSLATVLVIATLVRQLKIQLVLCLLEGFLHAYQCSTSSGLPDASLLAFLGSETSLLCGHSQGFASRQ